MKLGLSLRKVDTFGKKLDGNNLSNIFCSRGGGGGEEGVIMPR